MRYLAEDFRDTALWGGLVMLILGLFNALTAKHHTACHHGDECSDHDHEHSELHPAAAMTAMILPVVAASLLSQDAYSTSVLERKGLFNDSLNTSSFFQQKKKITKETLFQNTEKTVDGFYNIDLLDVYFAIGDSGTREIFEGLPVLLEGRITSEKKDGQHNRLRLYRVYVMCCAADSRPISLILEFPEQGPNYESIEWITAKGKLTYKKEDGILRPILEVVSYENSEAPEEEMLEQER